MFKFKGKSSEQMGVIAEEENFLIKASKRYEENQIDGRNGSIYIENGYNDVSVPLKITVLDETRLDEIFDWLDGAGIFEFNGRETYARFYDTLHAIRTSALKVIDTTFIREPFWHRAEDAFDLVSDTIINKGNFVSFPIIKLTGDGKVEMTIGDVRFKYNFDSDGQVIIDCESKKEEFNGYSKSRNIEIGFDYPSLKIGASKVIIHSGSAKIEVKRKDAWR